MTEVFADFPLAIFTTLATIGVGAYVTLAVAFVYGKFSPEEYQKTAKLSVIPLAFMVVGVLASFFHLANPINATNVFSTVGSTPMANEIIMLVVFGILAVIYWLAGGFAKMPGGTHKVLACILGVLGVVCCAFIGMAYLLPTVPSWNTLFTPIAMIGFGLFGGTPVAMLVLAKAGVADRVLEDDCANVSIGLNVLGFLMAVVGVIGIFMAAGSVDSSIVDAAAVAGAMLPFVVISIILMVFGVVGVFMGIKIAPWTSVSIILVVLITIAVFLARLAFYGMQIGIGL